MALGASYCVERDKIMNDEIKSRLKEISERNLDNTIAEFIAPRLRKFRKESTGYTGGFNSRAKWNEVLDKMIFAFDNLAKCLSMEDQEKIQDRIDEGLRLFAENFESLWY